MKFIITWCLFFSSSLVLGQETKPLEPIAKVEEQKDVFNLTSYAPVYFIYNPHSSKVQASFKYKLHRKYNLYIGYTHLILWDLAEDSRPFLDVNYNPEVFYRWKTTNKINLESVDLIPYGHVSNGKDGDDTRSLDYAGAQANFKFNLRRDRVLRTAVRVKYMGNFDQTNNTIREYSGPVELRFSLTDFSKGIIDKAELTGRLYTGGTYGEDFSRGGQEIGINFRVMGVDITPSFYLQYFHGYNESLRYFNEKEHIVRFGLLL